MPLQLSSNEHLDYIAALLDDMFRIPGTQIRFGLDALVGWIPGIGDALAGIASFLIVFAAWRRSVQAVTLVRMVANVLLETTLGAIPVAGDIFHIFWKANRRNYRLLIREKEQPGSNTGRDWMFLAIILFTAIAAAVRSLAVTQPAELSDRCPWQGRRIAGGTNDRKQKMNEAFEVKGSVRKLEQRKQGKQDPEDPLRRVRDLDSFDVAFSPSGQPILETSYTLERL
jgi:hypothetical protein